MGRVTWTEPANDYLRRAYAAKKVSRGDMARVLSEYLGAPLTPNAIAKQAGRLGLRKLAKPTNPPIEWTPNMLQAIKDGFAEGLDDAALAERVSALAGLSIAPHLVGRRRLKLGLGRDRQKWPGRATDYLKTIFTNTTNAEAARLLTAKFGRTFSESAVKNKIAYEGWDRLVYQGDLTIQQAADELGVARSRLVMFMERRGLEAYGNGFYRFVTEETMDTLRKAFPRITEPTMSVAEVAGALGYVVTTIRHWIQAETLPATMFGHEWRIPVTAVEAKRRELGITRPLPQTFGRTERKASA